MSELDLAYMGACVTIKYIRDECFGERYDRLKLSPEGHDALVEELQPLASFTANRLPGTPTQLQSIDGMQIVIRKEGD